MRELTADMFVSLDGFAAGADGGQSWTFGYFGPEFAAYAQRVLAEPQIMLMGRVTYEIMARSWASSPDPLAGPMNGLPKLVFSTTLAGPLAWNNAQPARNVQPRRSARSRTSPVTRCAPLAASAWSASWWRRAWSTGSAWWCSRTCSGRPAGSQSSPAIRRPASP